VRAETWTRFPGTWCMALSLTWSLDFSKITWICLILAVLESHPWIHWV
jgi:hypothetical protein